MEVPFRWPCQHFPDMVYYQRFRGYGPEAAKHNPPKLTEESFP